MYSRARSASEARRHTSRFDRRSASNSARCSTGERFAWPSAAFQASGSNGTSRGLSSARIRRKRSAWMSSIRKVTEHLDRAPRIGGRAPAERVVVDALDQLAELLWRGCHDLGWIVVAKPAELVLDKRMQLLLRHGWHLRRRAPVSRYG